MAKKLLKQRNNATMIKSLDRLALIKDQKIVETTVRFSMIWNDWIYGYVGYNPRPKIAQTTVRFSLKWTIESMNILAKIQGQKNYWNND